MASEDFASSGHSLAQLMTVKKIAPDQFVNGASCPMPGNVTFGGQLLGHALLAIMMTAEEYAPHSAHAYFLGRADATHPLDFAVKRLRDGGRLASRLVEVRQGDTLIMQMMASLRKPMPGMFDHQLDASTALPPPEACERLVEFADRINDPVAVKISNRLGSIHKDIEVRHIDETSFAEPRLEPRRRFWIRLHGAEAIDDPMTLTALMAYLSDCWLAGTTLLPHHMVIPGEYPGLVSLDHAIWFHRPSRLDDWLLYEVDSPNSAAGIGLARGLIYDRAGRLLASVAQEAMPMIK